MWYYMAYFGHIMFFCIKQVCNQTFIMDSFCIKVNLLVKQWALYGKMDLFSQKVDLFMKT